MPLRKAQKFQRLPGFFAPIFSSVTKRCQLPCQANSMDLYLYPRRFEPLFREFFGKAALFYSRQNVEFEQVFLLVLLDGHSECMCHCVDTGKAQNTLVQGIKNGDGIAKGECRSCGSSMVRKFMGRRHDRLDVYAPKGQESVYA